MADHDFSRVRFLVLDFDGVLTDNSVIVGVDGSESVVCSRADGMGFALLREADLDIDVFVLSKESNPVVGVRCLKLGIPYQQGVNDKVAVLTELIAERGLTAADVAYVGNDVNDLGCLDMVGLPIVVADAHPDVQGGGRFVTRTPGGRGAVREVIDRIIAAQTGKDRPTPIGFWAGNGGA